MDKFHETVAEGQDQYLKSTGELVKVLTINVSGTLEIILPDPVDDKGKRCGDGGSITLRRGDFLVGKADGSLFGVAKDNYAKELSPAPVLIPAKATMKEVGGVKLVEKKG